MSDKVITATKEDLKDLLREVVAKSNDGNRLQVISTEETMSRLNIKSPKTLKKLLKESNCALKPVKNGYIESSINDEILRQSKEKIRPRVMVTA